MTADSPASAAAPQISPGSDRAAPRRRWRRLRRALAIFVVLMLVATVAFATVKPFRVAVQTAALMPELMNLPIRPLSAVRPEPARRSLTYGSSRPDRIDVYIPSEATPQDARPAVLLGLGVHPLPLDHPGVVRVANAIGRLGLVVGIPESTAMRGGRVTADEPARLAEAFLVLASQPEVDDQHVGIVAFSAGAGVAFVAAADPRLAGRLAYLNSFGGYADAGTLVVDVVTRTSLVAGSAQPFEPDERARRSVLEMLLATIPDDSERDAVRRRTEPVVLAGERPDDAFDPVFARGLGPEALATYRLATAATRADAEAVIAAAPERLLAHVRAVSPSAVRDRVDAPIFLMHDENDPAIPHAHLQLLAGMLPRASVRRVTSFRLFHHVQPEAGGIGIDDAPELWKLYVHVHDLLSHAVE